MEDWFAGISLAIAANDVERLRTAFQHGLDINAVSTTGFTALTEAARQHRPEVVSELLVLGAEPNLVAPAIGTPLDAALSTINYSNEEEIRKVVGILIDGGARVDEPPLRHDPVATVVEWAAVEVLRLLLFAGAPVDRQEGGLTPLARVAHNPNRLGADIARMLIAEGANVNHTVPHEGPSDVQGRSILSLAIRTRQEEVVKELLLAGASGSDYLLADAARLDWPEVAQLCLDRGDSPYGVQESAASPLELAVVLDNNEVAAVLRASGAWETSEQHRLWNSSGFTGTDVPPGCISLIMVFNPKRHRASGRSAFQSIRSIWSKMTYLDRGDGSSGPYQIHSAEAERWLRTAIGGAPEAGDDAATIDSWLAAIRNRSWTWWRGEDFGGWIKIDVAGVEATADVWPLKAIVTVCNNSIAYLDRWVSNDQAAEIVARYRDLDQ